MKYDAKMVELHPLKLPPLDSVRKEDDDFMVDLIEASNELRECLLVTSNIVPSIELSPITGAVFFGLMVRLFKLYDTYVFLINEKRSEMALIMGRSACETAIDLAYLMKDLDNNKIDEFVRSSLANSRKFYDEIEIDKGRGTGNPIIQNRIQSSILEAFSAAGYKIEDIKAKDWRLLKSVADRAEDCELSRIYIFMYKNLSRITHGNWSELLLYHLSQKNGLYYPNNAYNYPRPQSLDGISILVADSAKIYADQIAPKSEVCERLKTISDWFRAMAFKHEGFMANSSKK